MNQLSLAGTPLEYFHICAFFNSSDEEYDILCPFYQEGLDQGEKNLHIVSPAMLDEHRTRLVAAGIDAHGCEACGQLEVLPWHQAYMTEDGRFDKELMLANLDRLTGSGREVEYWRLRIMGNMNWVFNGTLGVNDLIEYEAEVNEVLSRNRQPAVCVYDIAKLSGAMMMDLLRTHPLTLIGGVVQENPFYTAPAAMLAELQDRKKNLAPSQHATA